MSNHVKAREKNGSDFLRGRSTNLCSPFHSSFLKLQIWVSGCSHTLSLLLWLCAPGLMRTTLSVIFIFCSLVLLCAWWVRKQADLKACIGRTRLVQAANECCMDGTSPARNPSGSALIAFSSTLILFIAISFCEDKLNPFFLHPL